MPPSLPPLPDETDLAEILDLFEEHVYAGAMTADGHYVSHRSGPKLARFLGGPVPMERWEGFWESRIHPDDQAAYERFNQRLHVGEDAEITYRLLGLDGVTRLLWDRARPRRGPDGVVRVAGIISDVTSRNEAAARLAEASERFTRLLDVVGEHVYVMLAFPDGRFEELFQGPGADRLLGGAVPDSEMENWEAAIHPDDRAVYDGYNRSLAAGEDAEAEYRLVGADGITRWVHDRARCRRRADGAIEASGIVSDVTERRHMRAELAQAHAALSQAVDAMDAHLYTLRVDGNGAHVAVYRGPNRETLAGGELPEGEDGDRRFEALVHPEDRLRRAAVLTRLATGLPFDLEYRVIGLDGRERIVADRLRARRDPDGHLYYDGVLRDITERRNLEDELLRTLSEMQDAHRELERARAEAELRARTDELTGTFNRRTSPRSSRRRCATTRTARGCSCSSRPLQARQRSLRTPRRRRRARRARRAPARAPGAGEDLARWGGEEFALLLRGVRSDARSPSGPNGCAHASPALPSSPRASASDSPSRSGRSAPGASTPMSTRSSTPPTGGCTPPSGAAATGSRSRRMPAAHTPHRSPRRSAWRARSRLRPGRERASRRITPGTSQSSPRRPPSASACRPTSCCAVGSAAGCTTWARWRSRRRSSRSPARSMPPSGRSCGPTR